MTWGRRSLYGASATLLSGSAHSQASILMLPAAQTSLCLTPHTGPDCSYVRVPLKRCYVAAAGYEQLFNSQDGDVHEHH
jgi:hypothetical protein